MREYFENLNQTILRQIHNIPVDEAAAKLLKNVLYQASVTHISGPLIYLALFAKDLKNFDYAEVSLSNNMQKMRPFIECLSTSGLVPNGLECLVLGQDRSEQTKRQVLSDASWTPNGAKALKFHSMELTRRVVAMQRLIRLKLQESSTVQKPNNQPRC